MAFKASVSVLFGGRFSQANKLLSASERGIKEDVAEVLTSKPQLAAYTGFHGTTSPLHRAAAAGHLDVCKVIIELLKLQIQAAESGTTETPSRRDKNVRKWKNLLRTVLDQTTNKTMTALMIACDRGHANIVEYLLSQGADPLLVDLHYSRNCLHYAAAGGHINCLKVLLRDSTVVEVDGIKRPLRDVVITDIQIKTARFIDQRSYGGLTPLHFAVVSGSVEAVRVLVSRGAALMVRTDSEAFIGEENLIPGSSPLHVAVMIGNVTIVHTLLMAHAELMNIAGLGLDERGRRPWEGHSRTDIRSVRNSLRKLPYHLARERGWTQLMHLVDPRVPIDHSIDAARDTEHGIGPKRLSTICSRVLQESLMKWLDACSAEKNTATTATSSTVPTPISASPRKINVAGSMSKHQQTAVMSRQNSRSQLRTTVVENNATSNTATVESSSSSPFGSNSNTTDGTVTVALVDNQQQPSGSPQRPSSPLMSIPNITRHYTSTTTSNSTASEAMLSFVGLTTSFSAPPDIPSPFAAAECDETETETSLPDRHGHMNVQQSIPHMSAPTTPERLIMLAPQNESNTTTTEESNRTLPRNPIHAAHASAPPVTLLQIANRSTGQVASSTELTRGDSLHAYVGMLSEKRTLGSTSNSSSCHNGVRSSNISGGMRRVGTATEPLMMLNTTTASGGDNNSNTSMQYQQYATLQRLTGGTVRTLHDGTIVAIPPRYPSLAQPLSGATRAQTVATLKRTLSALGASLFGSNTVTNGDGNEHTNGIVSTEEDKGLCSVKSEMDTESDCCEKESRDGASSQEERECGVCLDMEVEVAFAGCAHKLCLECARALTRQDKKPPNCPFCRQMVTGFNKVKV